MELCNFYIFNIVVEERKTVMLNITSVYIVKYI